jgi:hypothetical protein
MTEEYDFDLFEPQMPQEAFHLEMDLYDTGEYYNLLFIPCNDVFIVVSNNEHFTTMVQNGGRGRYLGTAGRTRRR